MYRKVLARGPLPASLPVLPASQLTGRRATTFAESGHTLCFATQQQVKKKDELPCHLPRGFRGGAGEVGRTTLRGDEAVESPRAALVAGLGTHSTVRDYRLALTAAVHQAQRQSTNGGALLITPPNTDIFTEPDLFHPPRPLLKKELIERTATFAVTAAYKYDRLRSRNDTAESGEEDGGSGGEKVFYEDPVAEDDNAATGTAGKKKKSKGRRQASAEVAPQLAPHPLLLAIDAQDKHAIATGQVIGECVNDARNLGNLREDEGTPAFYAEWVQQTLLRHNRNIKLRAMLRGTEISRAGLNLLYNVGKGSRHTPHVLVLEYVGNRRSTAATALIGKGVTFDSGGLNVKPYGSMETMHTDMMGAATALCALKAAATLQLPVNLTVAVGFVENAIGPMSYHPSSILTTRHGLTVEIRNTDAEGRLVLADLLTFVQRDVELEKAPHTLIDLATLTGAIVVGLGERRAGLFSNSAQLSEALMSTGTRVGEELWPMPIGPEHQRAMKGRIADLINAAHGRAGGSCTAAAFLSNFVDPGHEWAHLDIAGTSDSGDKPKGYEPAGVTGFGVQLLVDHLRRNTVLRTRIPETGHRSAARLRWATYTFWYVLDPLLRVHFRYSRHKAQLDRLLEKNSFVTNCLLGGILGLTAYVAMVQLVLPPMVHETAEPAMGNKERINQIFETMNVDVTKELPTMTLMRLKRMMIGKLHTVIDLAEVRQQREAVEQLKREMGQPTSAPSQS